MHRTSGRVITSVGNEISGRISFANLGSATRANDVPLCCERGRELSKAEAYDLNGRN